MTLRPAFSALAADLEPGLQTHGHIRHAGLSEVQRMGVTLAAIADDGDLLPLDQIEIGIPIVIDAHTLSPALV